MGPGALARRAKLAGGARAARSTTVDALAPTCDHAAVVNAKVFQILMAAPLAAFAWLLYGGRARPIGLHIVFALHFVAFLLLIQLPLRLLVWLERVGVWPWDGDSSAGAASLAASALFLFVATGRVYGSRRVARALKVALFVGAVFVTFTGYRLVILLITLYTTKLG